MRRRRSRRALAPVAIAIIVVGLVGRFGLPPCPADVLGGIAYTALVYVLLAAAFPRARAVRLGVGAMLVSTAVELFQLTSVPADLGAAWSPLALVLGSGFAPTDLLAYAVGAAAAVGVDLAISREPEPAPG